MATVIDEQVLGSAPGELSPGERIPPAGGLSDEHVLQRIREAEYQARLAHSQLLEAIGEADTRGLAGQSGFRDTAQLLAAMLNLTRGHGRARVAEARQLTPRRSLIGQPLPPHLPATSHALATGMIGAAQVQVITATMGQLQQIGNLEQQRYAEEQLAAQGAHLDPTSLGRLGRRIMAHLDPDGPEPGSETVPAPAGDLRLRDRRDGGLGFEGWIAAEHAPGIRELIATLAVPRPASEGTVDPRGLDERQADALVEVFSLARAARHTPEAAGEPPHLSLTMSWSDLQADLGAAFLDYGTYLRSEDARRWACDAKIIPIVLGSDGEPLDVGRACRTAPAGIRRAVIARDRHCAFPGCGRPPARCQVHHIRHWADGGETALSNLCLLCDLHHRYIHHTGWEVTIRCGSVEFRPPGVIDPERRPLTNPLRQMP